MPVYGNEKVFHMIRSILPSTARGTARKDKVNLHQMNRSRSHNQLALYKGPASHVIDMYEDDEEDLVYYLEPHIGYDSIVWDRRAHDKLNHFVEWAFKRTAHKPGPERYPYMKTLLPDNLIGRHALSHLRDLKYPELQDYCYHKDAQAAMEKDLAEFGTSPRQWHSTDSYTAKHRKNLRDRKSQTKEMVDCILGDKKLLNRFNALLLSQYRNQRTAFILKHDRLFESAYAFPVKDHDYGNMKHDYMESIWERSDAPKLVKLNDVNKYRFYPIAQAYFTELKYILNIE